MAKLKSGKIEIHDLQEYLGSQSDFSFELSVLKMLRTKEIECEHGGHYEDPATSKSREFDIRAVRTIEGKRVRMAIECKNIRDNFPLLISCVPRHEQESYHHVALLCDPERTQDLIHITKSRAHTLEIRSKDSLYKPCEPVGKSTVQVGRGTDGAILANDSELYEKWGQCLSSAKDLMDRMYEDGSNGEPVMLSAIIPFVVVPNGRLWTVTYDDDGNITCNPQQVSRCSCYVGKEYELGTNMAGTNLTLSHVDIVTIDGLKDFIDQHLQSEEGIEAVFPKQAIKDAYSRSR